MATGFDQAVAQFIAIHWYRKGFVSWGGTMHVTILNWQTFLIICTTATKALNPLGYQATQSRILNKSDTR